MSENDQITGRQIAAGRTLAGIGQDELAGLANISAPTLRRMEASEGAATGLANNVLAVRRALEVAGVEFIPENGSGPGVRLKKKAPTSKDLAEKIEDLHERLPEVDEKAKPSPQKAMKQLERAHGKNEIAKAKARQAKTVKKGGEPK